MRDGEHYPIHEKVGGILRNEMIDVTEREDRIIDDDTLPFAELDDDCYDIYAALDNENKIKDYIWYL